MERLSYYDSFSPKNVDTTQINYLLKAEDDELLALIIEIFKKHSHSWSIPQDVLEKELERIANRDNLGAFLVSVYDRVSGRTLDIDENTVTIREEVIDYCYRSARIIPLSEHIGRMIDTVQSTLAGLLAKKISR